MVDISPYGDFLTIVSPSWYEPSIFVDSYLSSSEKKIRLGWLRLEDNHSSNSW